MLVTKNNDVSKLNSMQLEKYILVDNEEALASLLADLELYDMAAVDTEADSMHHYATRLCLIQITIGEHHYIVDALCNLDLSPLFKAKAMQTLIFHGADYDLRLLWQKFGFSPKKIFDTMLAAKLLGESHLGLADLVYKFFNEKLKKENQRADWTIRPLSLDMCEYAIHDTFYLHELCAILAEKLQKIGRLHWHEEQCDFLIEHSKQNNEKKHEPWRISGSNIYPPLALNILKNIWEWREEEAKALDRPPYKVMTNDLILAIVRASQITFPEVDLDRLPRLPRNFREERLNSFISMLQDALNKPENEWPEKLPKAPAPTIIPHSELFLALKLWRDEKALQMNLDSSLLANKGQLVFLAVPGSTPWEVRYQNAKLMNWQKEIWNEILQERIPTAQRIGV